MKHYLIQYHNNLIIDTPLELSNIYLKKKFSEKDLSKDMLLDPVIDINKHYVINKMVSKVI